MRCVKLRSTSRSANGETTSTTEVDRLKRRLGREREARHEAEAIAERTTRTLYAEIA